jgi:hypothetical protein
VIESINAADHFTGKLQPPQQPEPFIVTQAGGPLFGIPEELLNRVCPSPPIDNLKELAEPGTYYHALRTKVGV